MKRGILYTFLAQAPTVVLYFLSSTLITRMLGDTGRGEFALLNNQVALLTMLVGLNLGYGITYFTARSVSDRRRSVGTATTLFLLAAALLPLLLWGLAGSSKITDLLMPANRSGMFYWGFVYISIVVGLFNTSIGAVLLGMKKFKALNAMSILNAAVSTLAFSLLYLARWNAVEVDALYPILVLTLCIKVVPVTCWILLYRRHVKIMPVPNRGWESIKPLLSFSLIGYFANLINLINYRFDVWVVDQYHGTAALGLYAVAVGVGQLLFYLPEPFARVVQPFLFSQKGDEMLGRYKAVARLNFTSLVLLAIGLGALAHWFLPLLYGDVFGQAAWALRLLLPGIVFSGATKLLIPLITERGFQHLSLLAMGAGAVITITFDLLLVPSWGIEGASVASSIAYLSILAALLMVIKFRIGLPVWDLFLLRRSDLLLLRQEFGRP